MLIQNRDGSLSKQPTQRRLCTHKPGIYYAAVPAHVLAIQSSVIDQLIAFAFDTLEVLCLDVRVYDEAASASLTE
jgi:hypothetical protein